MRLALQILALAIVVSTLACDRLPERLPFLSAEPTLAPEPTPTTVTRNPIPAVVFATRIPTSTRPQFAVPTPQTQPPTLPVVVPTQRARPTIALNPPRTPVPTIAVPTPPLAIPVTRGAVPVPTIPRVYVFRVDTGETSIDGGAVFRNIQLKEQLLDLTNAERKIAGVPPVSLGNNPAAQLHAEASLRGCYTGHWDRWGLKPNHRYTLTGGSGADAENVSGSAYCIGPDDGYAPIASLSDKVVETVQSWMASPGHRATMLNPAFTILNAGVAHDEYNSVMVQQFSTHYVTYETRPAIDSSGELVLKGRVSDATLDIGNLAAVAIAYDPPPQPLTRGQLAYTYSLCPPFEVAILLQPAPAGSSYGELPDLPPKP